MTRRLYFLALICTWSYLADSQQDTSYLNYDQLHWSDVIRNTDDQLMTKVIAGTRTERNLEDLPFTVYVITAEEIREQGYFTLTDAIKHLPGIRVSQPGSGLDGETFFMRGLYGNTYTKILINDQPLRPSVIGALPIGSQLPIRQAERIEVIYGPAATLYGADASSGVINIILKDSDYPTFAQADIETGGEDLTRLSAMFGGKFALGQKTLKLKMYGGFTSFSDRRIKYDTDSLYNPAIYEKLANSRDVVGYVDRPNYVGTKENPVLSNLPHQSSYIGFTASIGSFEFNTQRLFREDHSSIGLSPYAVSYANPQSLIGEEIFTSALTFRRQYSKWDFKIQAGSLSYSMNPLSSYSYVLPTFGIVTNRYFHANGIRGSKVDGPETIDSLYLSGLRYLKSDASDIYLETQFNFRLNDHVSLSAGLQTLTGFGDAGESFNALPENTRAQLIQPPVLPGLDVVFTEGSAFAEGYFNYGPFQALLGAQVFLRADSLVDNDPEFNPRLGLLYRATPHFSIRASFSSAFRYPSPFLTGSSYEVLAKDDFIEVERIVPGLEPERTNSYEAGVRWTISPGLRMDGCFYYTKTSNYINYEFFRGENGSFMWGYRNVPDSYNRLTGTQVNLFTDRLWPAIGLTTDISLNYSFGKEKLLKISLVESRDRTLLDLPVVRSQPDFIGHLQMSFDAGKYIRIHLNHTYLTGSWTRNKFRISAAYENGNFETLKNPGYYTLDFRSVFTVSRQLDAYLAVSNVTNAQYAGIDASIDPDVLLYNPQPLTTLKVGVSFAFN